MIKEKDVMKLEEREVYRENGMSRLEDMGGVLYILIKSKIKKWFWKYSILRKIIRKKVEILEI